MVAIPLFFTFFIVLDVQVVFSFVIVQGVTMNVFTRHFCIKYVVVFDYINNVAIANS